MATNAYMYFQTYKPDYLASESQADLTRLTSSTLTKPFIDAGVGHIFEIEDYSFDIEQTLNIGSQISGAGAGKITFNPFSITRKVDRASPVLFDMACSGTAFQTVGLALTRSTGGGGSAPPIQLALTFTFKLVAIKTMAFADAPEMAKETIAFEYGGLQVHYSQQSAAGAPGPIVVGGWNRVHNVIDHDVQPIGGGLVRAPSLAP
jgi:type VI secretion system Hcp family effector